MGEGVTIDARMMAALARLTDNEKECLRRRLRQQTAKEMAIELGISPHAVEKRLKMARTKLGLSSSLEAARLLAASERYQQAGPQTADLETPIGRSDKRISQPLILGVATMSFIAMALLTAYATQPGSVANDVSRTLAADAPDAGQYLSASAAPEQVEEYVRDFFAKFDRDGSGFIERSEGPRQIDLTCCGASGDQTARQGDVLTGEAAWRRFLSDNGDDGDDRISFAEFRNARYEQLLRDGIPVRREDVAMVGNRPSPYAERQPGGTQGRIYSEELDYVEASPERVRAYVRRMFDNWDTDKSGFVELAEAPSSLITQQARMGANGKATYDPDDPPKELLGHAARQQYVANVDKDNDGKVSFEEFAEPVMPQFLQRGIPLIPADWTPSPPTRD